MKINNLPIHNIKNINIHHLLLPSNKKDQIITLFMNYGKISVLNENGKDITNITFTKKKIKQLSRVKDISSYSFVTLGVMTDKRDITLFDIMSEKEYYNKTNKKLFVRIKRFNNIKENFKHLNYINFIDNTRIVDYNKIIHTYITNYRNIDSIMYLFDYNFNFKDYNRRSYILYRNDFKRDNKNEK